MIHPERTIELGLDRVQSCLAVLGHPEQSVGQIVHIAGTNGKGSTLAFLEVLLASSSLPKKLKIGRYTSPHLMTVRERFRVDGEPISDARLRQIQEFVSSRLLADHTNKYPGTEIVQLADPEGQPLTYFEALTVLGFCYFSQEAVDVLLLETGLGGRLDATNVITPTISLITNIGRDHEQYLGTTIESITSEKAGILKPGRPFATTAVGIAAKIIRQTAKSLNCPELPLVHDPIDHSRLGLRGIHQENNARLALTAMVHLYSVMGLPLPAEHTTPLYRSIPWAGRFQEVQAFRHRVVLDGAHNLHGAHALRQTLDTYYPNEQRLWLIGLLQDKDAQSILTELLRPVDRVIFTIPSEHTDNHPPETLAYYTSHILSSKPTLIADRSFALDTFVGRLRETSHSTVGVVCGSLYLLGNIMPELMLSVR